MKNYTLVTFLGKGRENRETGYRKTRYRFPGEVEPRPETAFLGLELAKYLKPDVLVILGTSGSQWGVLMENLALEGQEEEKRICLMDAEATATVEQQTLDGLTDVLSGATGYNVMPMLIPFGKNAEEQYNILDTVADAVPNGAVSFDVTHGFRHLGMVGFLSAFMLERVRNLAVRDLWYGALDMTENGVTPVLKLDGLTHVQRWVSALDRFDATGDYGVFEPLLIEDGVAEDKAKCLKEAAFFERNFNVSDAKRKIHTFLSELESLSGASGLFRKKLRERLVWVKESDLGEHQRKLAFQYLNRGDFVRAAVLGWEATITRQCLLRDKSPDEFPARKETQEKFESELKEQKYEQRKVEAYWDLKDLRNALAHGGEPSCKHIRQILKDPNPERLHREIETCLQRLLN
ncbi:MAG: TIGR02221 family CRISPR-associated protein [Nitrospira sp. SB0677_bin_15]|nr:TIGR02221 family CRISPR-associated protein [Nitrospira sp. SB0667_bin_9]MYD30011.1 TIGR02221 family CRISPR-associated protein [Nitrospira sp. SB0661_bin_20]MYG40590.1 TIGR02221 family CRISPR-associated protein [Nitrospira sp. SB0677_bin_15]MYH02215.1 TIGR02221 family CRISPR-associated protein [Nitrospira sp. SB0675_bin_23]MYJ23129.1 TIGR02221 family CRISPR-associated protein [Nitrospira sp. SB0673_bin_12]